MLPAILMVVCEECGSRDVRPIVVDGLPVGECGLCGALSGADANVERVQLRREAEDLGVHPSIYPLVHLLHRLEGLRVVRSEAGDPAARVWPYVQIGFQAAPPRTIENLVKSIALGNAGSDIHWVFELEYQQQLVMTLKPRFHTDVQRIGPADVERAREDLGRIQRNLQRDMRLSWWRG